jgi:hypothetical protein
MYRVYRTSYWGKEEVGDYRFKFVADTVAALVSMFGNGEFVGYTYKIPSTSGR